MKKIYLSLLLAMVCVGSALAQKGMQGVGVNATTNYCNQSSFCFGGSIKYQYNISNRLRLEPSFALYSGDNDYFDMMGFFNMDFFLMNPKRVRPYVFIGVGYTDFKYTYGKHSTVGIDAGIGLDCRLGHALSMQIEAGGIYSFQDSSAYSDFAPIVNLGITYNF